MITVILDTNCVIDLEENRPNANALREIIMLAEQGQTAIGIPAIMASERGKDGKIAETFTDFQRKLEACGLRSAEVLPLLAYWGVTFWCHEYWHETDRDGLEGNSV